MIEDSRRIVILINYSSFITVINVQHCGVLFAMHVFM
jgi:hypothetical protein